MMMGFLLRPLLAVAAALDASVLSLRLLRLLVVVRGLLEDPEVGGPRPRGTAAFSGQVMEREVGGGLDDVLLVVEEGGDEEDGDDEARQRERRAGPAWGRLLGGRRRRRGRRLAALLHRARRLLEE
uniref:Uncharacterized protein n=1 Tax=Arundo donax TaxID=35708 RepID=A0A0A9GPS1_ARUDO